MSRRRAAVTQADVARIIRAAKQAGAATVELKLNGEPVIIRLKDADPPLADQSEPVVL